MTTVRRWPLFLIAAPAAVAVWSGWVGLGQLCGFGLVQPFPGITSWHLDTAITLPVGVEAYGAYALGAWLTPGVSGRARTFARRSAISALALGMAGQVAYHVLSAAHATRAPSLVVVLVSCLPVVTLGFGAALTHLLKNAPEHDRGDDFAAFPRVVPGDPGTTVEVTPAGAPGAFPETVPGPLLHPALEAAPGGPRSRSPRRSPAPAGNGKQPGPATPERLREFYAADLAVGQVPSIRQIKREWPVGYEAASELHDHLEAARTTS
jgi:hypothetical protein